MVKTSQIKSQDQKLAPLEKVYLPSYWTSEAKVYMVDVQGGDLSYHKNIFPNDQFWLSYYMLKMFHIRYWASFIYTEGINPTTFWGL